MRLAHSKLSNAAQGQYHQQRFRTCHILRHLALPLTRLGYHRMDQQNHINRPMSHPPREATTMDAIHITLVAPPIYHVSAKATRKNALPTRLCSARDSARTLLVNSSYPRDIASVDLALTSHCGGLVGEGVGRVAIARHPRPACGILDKVLAHSPCFAG